MGGTYTVTTSLCTFMRLFYSMLAFLSTVQSLVIYLRTQKHTFRYLLVIWYYTVRSYIDCSTKYATVSDMNMNEAWTRLREIDPNGQKGTFTVPYRMWGVGLC